MKGVAYVIHLVRDRLDPILSRFEAGDHARQLGSDHGLSGERLPKDDALRSPSARGAGQQASGKNIKREPKLT